VPPRPRPGSRLVPYTTLFRSTFVAQSFSGDKSQLVPLLKAAIRHRGFAFLNVISPCVTFNNNQGSTKSYDYVRGHLEATSTLDRSEEHTSELQSRENLVCRLL